MATIIELPISALNDTQAPLQAESQPRRDSIEIIDVDAFDQETSRRQSGSVFRPQNHGQRANPEAISVLDSDDDDFVEILSPRLQPNHNVNGNRSRRYFVATAPRDHSAPPPVPPVPQRFAGHTSLPIRRRIPRLDPLPIIPNEEPFAFEIPDSSPERPVAGPSNHNRNTAAPQPAPPSHHNPVMGLGGGLITTNRAQALQRFAERESQRRAAPVARRLPGAPLNRLSQRRFGPVAFLHDAEDDPHLHQRIHMLVNDRMSVEALGILAFSPQPPRPASADAREKEQYQQSYTHPPQPEPGFTFDFEISSTDDLTGRRKQFFPPTSINEPIVLDDDDDEVASTPVAGSSSSSDVQEVSSDAGKLNAVIICARCMDPLILNADLDPEEAQMKRVWALRCGHLIDERCLNELGQPSDESLPVDKKGKGKAKAPVKDNGILSNPALAENEGIRSRLRSHLSVANFYSSAAAVSSYLSSHSTSSHNVGPHPSAPKKRRVSKKGKVEAEYEWKCPVTSCGRVHVSVKIDGIWGPEKENEAPKKKAVIGGGAQARERGVVESAG